jgi:DNA-packaging protein gp3
MAGGRPLLYQSSDDLKRDIDAYFSAIEAHNLSHPLNPRHPTMAGLAVALNCCRATLVNYANKDEFLVPIKTAKARVEAYVEERLYLPNATGCIFSLKNNFGWEDKQETKQTGETTITVVTGVPRSPKDA